MPRAYRNGPEGDAGLSKEGRRCSQEEQRRLCFSSPQRGPVRHKEHSQSFNRTSKSFLCALRVSAVKNVVFSMCALAVFVQGASQAPQALGGHFRVSAHAQAEMPRHLEK